MRSFAIVWEEREALKVVLRVQNLLLKRKLRSAEVSPRGNGYGNLPMLG